MTIFIFSDGADWLSEVPWLSMVEDENTSKEPAQVVCEVTKKPVTGQLLHKRRPSGTASTRRCTILPRKSTKRRCSRASESITKSRGVNF